MQPYNLVGPEDIVAEAERVRNSGRDRFHKGLYACAIRRM
jgi:hypothetical protein